MPNRCIRNFLMLALLLSLALAVAGQQRIPRELAAKTISYGFVSPNTREDLKLDEALRNLTSADEQRLVRETGLLACRVRARARINRALGNWADGAENSLIFRLYSDEPTVRYTVASLGQSWHQKTVLYFRRQRSGQARLYVISTWQQQHSLDSAMRRVARTLDAAGVNYRTLVPLRTRVLIYVVDLNNELRPQVRSAARRLHARPLSFAGSGGFIGDDHNRQRAQELFGQEVKAYEAKHSLNQRCR